MYIMTFAGSGPTAEAAAAQAAQDANVWLRMHVARVVSISTSTSVGSPKGGPHDGTWAEHIITLLVKSEPEPSEH